MSVLAKALSESLKREDKTLRFVGFAGLEAEYSFSEFGRQVEETAQQLKALGVGPGVVVAVLGPTSVNLCRSCAAVWMLGGTLTVLATPTRLGSVEQFFSETSSKVERSQAKLMLADESIAMGFQDLLEIPVLDWDDLESAELALKDGEIQNHHPALIQFSSGTTRDPQPIMLSPEALLANAQAVLQEFPSEASQHSCVSWLPLYHDMGLIGCFLMPLLAPGDLTLMAPEVFAARPVTWLEVVSEYSATTSSAPNFALAYCVDRLTDSEMEGLDLSSWQISMVGAETVRPRTLRRFTERFKQFGFQAEAFSPVYGLAEATLAVTFSPLGKGLKTILLDRSRLSADGVVAGGSDESPSLGRPLENVEVEIRDGNKVLVEGRVGEVWVKSPSLLSGILGQPEALSQLCQEGWLRTGDLGFLHCGELHLCGRRKDILLIAGRNHDPVLVEEIAEEFSDLRRCCAFVEPNPDEERDELVLLCEISASSTAHRNELSAQIIKAIRRETLLSVDLLKFVESGSLPVTSSGKLRRGVASERWSQGQIPVAPASS